MKTKKLMRISISIISLALYTAGGTSPALAIAEGGKCSTAKYSNNLVMSNGKIHGGEFGPNKNYSGPLYLCESGYWVYWRTAQPKSESSQKTVDVKPGQACTKFGRSVVSTNYGTLVCSYVRVGKLQALIWTK